MIELSGKTYNELEELYKSKSVEYQSIQEECLKSRLSWLEAENKLRPTAEEMFMIRQEQRLIAEPEITFGREWKGATIRMNDFIKKVKDHVITDKSGYGFYATENGKSDIHIYPSDILMDKYRKDFTHVVWFE